jgi:DNA-binding SARP family transcriptional activator
LLNRDRAHNREKLATLIWAEGSPSQTKKNLRQALWHIQSGLSADDGQEKILSVDQHLVSINSAAALWLDIADFEAAFDQVQERPGRELTVHEVAALKNAVRLYKGDLLEGCYQEWCIYERERYLAMYLSILDKLLSYCEAHHEYETGIAYGTEILRHDPARERTHRRLMQLHFECGNRSAALQQYAACVAALARELNVGPSVSTDELYQRICADEPVVAHQPPAVLNYAPPHPMDSTPVACLADELELVHTQLNSLQSHVQRLLASLGRFEHYASK